MNMTTRYHPNARISLVGAGPGEAGLITVKGLRAIQSARVLVYDALVNKELLGAAPSDAILIYAGKRAGHHHLRQKDLQHLLVRMARIHGHVVRLKGGDPFVFGRGHEELEHARKAGIPTTLVPGISSCIAVAELQEVPVTRRGYAESFWVLTGTTRSGQISEDVALAAQSTATVVILMAIRKLDAICEEFCRSGKADCPAMVIQDGSLPGEKVVLAPVRDLAARCRQEKMGTPGIIVIGEVVGLHPSTVAKQVVQKLKVA